MIISLRGGEEDEKKKQPDSEEEKKMTAISFCSMDGVTPPFERAMLYGAREAIFITLPMHRPMNSDFHYLTQAETKRLFTRSGRARAKETRLSRRSL
jgi:hypothetical protein